MVIVSMYNSGYWERMERTIRKILEEDKNKYVIIGDFNIIGEKGEFDEVGIHEKSKDKVVGNTGMKLISLVEEDIY